tara:strand:- start:291 stop:1652 length:1362 start_codon:yes stop_codon:yes gene_type:complete
MKKISIRNGKFSVGHKDYYEQESQDFIEVVIVNASSVQRVYYEGDYDPTNPQAPVCWSSDTQQPDSVVEQKQSVHCMDCSHAVRGSAPNGGRSCKFSQKLAVVFENDLYDVHQLQVPANSIFGRAQQGHMPLQEYAKFLSKNDTPALTVFTKIYFDRASTFPKLFFTPIRAAEKCELKLLQNIVGHPDSIEAITLNYNVMENKEVEYIIESATVFWPKLDQPYLFDKSSNRSHPCDKDTENAAFEVDVHLDWKQAKKLRDAMKKYHEKEGTGSFVDGFAYVDPQTGREIDAEEAKKLDKEKRTWRKKCRVKAKYPWGYTQKPQMIKANLQPCPDDFQLTTGSTVNIKVSFTQYEVGTRTVNCHPKAVQVLSLAERKEMATGFKAVEGYGSSDDDPTSGFTAVGEEPVKQEASNDDFDDEPEEPKKVAKKEKPSPKVKDDDDDLNAIIDEWGDD